MYRFTLIAFAALIFPALAEGQELGVEWIIDPIEWSADIEPGMSVVVRNAHGRLRLRGSDRQRVELIGRFQHHVDDPRQPKVVFSREAGKLSLELQYPEVADLPDPLPDTWRKRRVDATIFVPNSSPLRGETEGGQIRVRQFTGDLELVSDSGNIKLRAPGRVQARTSYGSIDAILLSESWSKPHMFETVTGDITVTLPWKSSPQAELETRGVFSSDYSIDINWLPGSQLKRGSIRSAAPSGELRLISNRGNVRLLRIPWPAAADGSDPTQQN